MSRIIDFHTLMENIQQSIVVTESIARLNYLYKLKIDTTSQGIAIPSFERNVPIFSPPLTHTRLPKMLNHNSIQYVTMIYGTNLLAGLNMH